MVAPCCLGRHAAAQSQSRPTSDHNAGDFTHLGLWKQTQAHNVVILMLTAAKTLPASKQLGSGWVICKAVFWCQQASVFTHSTSVNIIDLPSTNREKERERARVRVCVAKQGVISIVTCVGTVWPQSWEWKIEQKCGYIPKQTFQSQHACTCTRTYTLMPVLALQSTLACALVGAGEKVAAQTLFQCHNVTFYP